MRATLGPLSLGWPAACAAAFDGVSRVSAGLHSCADDPPRSSDADELRRHALTITSATNARLKLIRKLHARRGREKAGLILLEGHRLLQDAIDAGYAPDFVLLSEEALSAPEGGRLATALLQSTSSEQRAIAPAELIAQLSDTQTPQGVIAVLPQPALQMPSAPTLVLVLDRVKDPGNLGTLLRSAAGAGVDAAIFLSGCCDQWGLKTLRAGMGAQLRLPSVEAGSYGAALGLLRGWGCQVLAADAAGTTDYWDVDWREPTALVVGSEAHGLAEEVLANPQTKLCRIPLAKQVESLNAAVAGSIMLFEAGRQRQRRDPPMGA